MTTAGDEFFDRLRNLNNQARRIATSEEEILVDFRRSRENFAVSHDTPEVEQRDLYYYVVPKNELANPSFIDDLTSWTETIDGALTATTARDTTQSKSVFGSMASLKVDVTASSGTGDAKRTQAVTAAVSESWSFEAWVKVTALTNCKAVVKIEWLDGGASVLATTTKEFTAVSTTWERTGPGFPYTFPITFLGDIEGLTAPSSTAQVRVSLGLEATASGAIGTAYFDLVRAEKQSTISDRSQRIIVGEFVVS